MSYLEVKYPLDVWQSLQISFQQFSSWILVQLNESGGDSQLTKLLCLNCLPFPLCFYVPGGISPDIHKILLYPYYTIKDILGVLFLILALLMLILFSVHLLGNSKYTSDNSIKTPLHIKSHDTSYSPVQSYSPFLIIQWMYRPQTSKL